ncbi:MAG: PAS domain S-box protein [Thermodesulfobacteriota bacterium]|nr:PAS domain S-box protein [Thermodesulfobacteriota bacterium]
MKANQVIRKSKKTSLPIINERQLQEAVIETEERLRESEEKYRTILENIEDGYYEVDLAGNFTFFNDSICRLLGYSKDEMMGMNNLQYTDQENAKKLYQTFNRVYHTGNPTKEFDWEIIRKDGTKRYIETSVSLMKNSSGQPIGFRGIVRDITERKRSEEALQRSEESSRELAKENAIMAKIGRIISSTMNIEEVYERFSEEVRKLNPFDLIVINQINLESNTTTIAYTTGIEVLDRRAGDIIPLRGTLAEEIYRKRSSLILQMDNLEELTNRFPGLVPTFQAGIRSIISVPLISKDQVIGTLSLRSKISNAYSDQDLKLAERVGHQITGAIANAQLFVEQKRTEEALRRSEEETKKLAQENAVIAEIGRIMSSSLNIEGIYDNLSKEVRKLIPFDRITINLTDLKDNTVKVAYVSGFDVVGRSVGDVIPFAGSVNEHIMKTQSSLFIQVQDEKDIKKVIATLPNLLPYFQAGTRSMMSVPLFSKDQIIGVLHIRSFKPNAYSERDLRLTERVGHQIAGAIANAQLFTERMRAEESKTFIEEQLRQSQKMEAVGQLAGGIAHDFNNLLTVIKGYCQLSILDIKENDPLKGNIEEIQKASERAADLTRQLLAFSRRQILDLKVVSLNTIIQDLDKMLHRILGEDIELVYVLGENLGKVKTDPGQIEQVIMNLAVNARDAMPSGGKLTIETLNMELSEAYAQTHMVVTPGHYVMLSVSDSGAGMTPEVRERIFEPFFTTKEKGKGTGLGLSTVYGIVKQSSGNIWVYSELGKGTTFKIYLPRVDAPLEEWISEEDAQGIPSGTETILVVEDEEEVWKMTCLILNKQGYRVLEAHDGSEALSLFKERNETIDLVLTDVVMPGMSGRQLADQLKTISQGTKVLYMSGYTDNALAHHGILEEGIHYIQKPFAVEKLARKVRQVLAS